MSRYAERSSAAAIVWLLAASCFSASPSLAAAPSPQTSLALDGGAYLHLYALPLGFMPGSIVGGAAFDATGTRAVFVCTFPSAALFGDPHRLSPSQAFVLDVSRRHLTQLSVDGEVSSATWAGPDQVVVHDGASDAMYSMTPPAASAIPAYRMSSDQSLRGNLAVVSPAQSDRITVYRRSDGRYVTREIGAKRLRVQGVARNGAYAMLGTYLAWVDRRAGAAASIDRAGASNALPPRFDDAFGRQLVTILPLGSAVSQGAYRNGVAYFAFSHGLTRVIAATRDFVNYDYPRMPDDPAYSVGDGLGALDDGSLYLAWPEGLQLSVRRGSRFVTLPMSLPSGYSDPQALIGALGSRGNAAHAWPELHPDEDALDAALLQWRVYPRGTGPVTRWIATYLGRVYLGDERATFVTAPPPAFPFAVLTRTDDGTLWGASPVTNSGHAGLSSVATLWSSRDGAHWHVRYALDGAPGAVGSSGPARWVAVTKTWHGTAMIAVARLGDDANPVSLPTGGSFAGEQLFFATLPSGLYLVWGATAGRAPSDQGVLSAFRVDPKQLLATDAAGLNAYARARLAGSASTPSGTGIGGPAMLKATVAELDAWHGDTSPTLETNVEGADQSGGIVTVRTVDDESVWEAEFASRPAPLGVVKAAIAGDEVVVSRAIWFGPLRGHGATERWQRGPDGAWRLAQTLRSWSF